MNLSGKVALITGGSSGLGRDIATLLHEAGCTVLICSRSKVKLNTQPWFTKWDELDLTNHTSVDEFINKTLRRYENIDILINNAGFGGSLTPFINTSDHDLLLHTTLNFLTPFRLIKGLLPAMVKDTDSWICNISSQAGKKAVPNLAAYSATKFALVGMTQALAKENMCSNISCITVCPAGMNTEMRESLFGIKDAQKQQSSMSVAKIIKDILTKIIPVENGSEIIIKNGRIQRIELSPNY